VRNHCSSVISANAFVLEAELVEGVDLIGDAFFLLERGFKHLGERIELAGRLRDLQQLDHTVARVDEVKQLHAVAVLFGALGLSQLAAPVNCSRSQKAAIARY
jgi:hypothetical protein